MFRFFQFNFTRVCISLTPTGEALAPLYEKSISDGSSSLLLDWSKASTVLEYDWLNAVEPLSAFVQSPACVLLIKALMETLDTDWIMLLWWRWDYTQLYENTMTLHLLPADILWYRRCIWRSGCVFADKHKQGFFTRITGFTCANTGLEKKAIFRETQSAK